MTDTRPNAWPDLLASGETVLADGAMGTLLHARGVSLEACFDELNLTQPELIASVHRDYAMAGALILETNTFGANAYKLAAHGLEGRMAEINVAAVRLARAAAEAADHPVLLAGSIGPLGVRLAPFGRIQPEQAANAFLRQIEALVEGGVDLLIFETHTDIREAVLGVEVARRVTRLPIIASMTFTRDDRTLLGDSPAQVAEALARSGADVIGANCSAGPAQLLRILQAMRRAAPEARLSVMPNAGWPERVGGRILYTATPEYFGEYARAFRGAGATLIGGCCGTTPDHIASMRAALDRPPGEAEPAPAPELHVSTSAPSFRSPDQPTRLARRLTEGAFLVAVELDPPRGFSTHKLLAAAQLLAEAGADVIHVADSPMARMRMSPWAVCHLIQRETGLETVLHFPTRGRNLLRIQGDLLAAHALGVRNVFVVMGDPTAVGDYPEAMDDFDVPPSGLIRLIQHNFNTGVDQAGADIGGATSFVVGCAVNLCAPDLEREARVLHRKIAAGADFILSQPVYDTQVVRTFRELYTARYGPLTTPLLLGLLPLHSERHASFLHNEVPGIKIPEAIRRRIARAGSAGPAEGVRIARELLEALRNEIQGVYLMPAFQRYDLAAEVVEAARGGPHPLPLSPKGPPAAGAGEG
ncbi:MAG TPA: bifunctional homocysteine S-methyltransferase/methylenetetrahydrofolate reductase [Anaerolineales bacterium]|nr:bifunctional homocysteine S-methyltransferase/methylenetetrahydrofolate reductase [Anaerolineales bacterium]